LTRAWETALGGAVAIAATACLWRPDPVARLAEELDAARLHLAADLLAAEAALRADDRTARQVRRRVAGHAAAVEAGLAQLAEAEDAQRWWRRHLMPNGTLDRLEARLRAVAALYRHVRGLSRCALERTAPHPPSEPRAEAARHLAAACAALAPEAAPRTAPFLIEPAEEAVTAYWKHALRAGEAAEAAPVVTALRRLCADLRTALGGGI
jgi:hypothetical protein